MSIPIKLVSFEILHKNCWSLDTKNYKITTRVLNKTFNKDDTFSFYLLVWGTDVKGFIEGIKGKRQILDLEVIDINRRFGILRLEHMGIGTITELVRRYNGIILSEGLNNGIEKWRVIINSKYLRTFKDELFRHGEVVSYNEIVPSELIPPPILTRKQIDVLKVALEKGYFDYPKKIRGEEIASLLNMRASTFVYHLRNAEKSILEFYLKNFVE